MREKLDKNKDCVLQWFLSDLSFCFSLNFISWPHEVYFVLGARNTSSALWRNLPTKVIIINIWINLFVCCLSVCQPIPPQLLLHFMANMVFQIGILQLPNPEVLSQCWPLTSSLSSPPHHEPSSWQHVWELCLSLPPIKQFQTSVNTSFCGLWVAVENKTDVQEQEQGCLRWAHEWVVCSDMLSFV